MRRRALLAAGLVVLLFAGVATAAVLTRKVTLHSGACVTIAKTRVCAAKARTVTLSHNLTITEPGKTVTVNSVSIVTVTVPGANPPPTTTISQSPVTEDYSGDGDLTEAPFTTPVGETLTWTWVNGNGDFPTGMFINDDSAGQVLVDSMATSGSTYLAPGAHTLSVVTIGTWTIHVGP
jgi:hypothetical protein